MNAIDRRILLGILADFDRLRAIDPESIDRRNDTARYVVVLAAHEDRLVPRAAIQWIQEYTDAAAKAAQRSLLRLEDDGYIVRTARWGDRMTGVVLTPKGERTARELTKGSSCEPATN